MHDEIITTRILKQGYFIHYKESSSDNPKQRNIFCGEQNIIGARCPNCKWRLLRFFSIDLDQSPFNTETSGIGYVHCLFCWRCGTAQGNFYYKLVNDNEIKIIQYNKGKREVGFPYKRYPRFFPQGDIAFEKLSSELQKAYYDFNHGEDYSIPKNYEFGEFIKLRHQIGGEPFLIQPAENLICPVCNNGMPFLLAVADDCLDPRRFTSNWGVQVLYFICPDCRVVGCFAQCD